MNAIQKLIQLVAKPERSLKSEVLSVQNTDTANAPEKVAKKASGRISNLIVKQRLFLSIEGQEDLRNAIIYAENPHNPKRQLLYEFYTEVLKDLHLRSQMRTAINEVLSEPWALVDKKSGKINEEATKKLQTKWFMDVSRLVLEAEFWGHSLIEFGILQENEDGQGWEFKEVTLFPREHVRPEDGMILRNPGDDKGLPFREPPFNTWLIEAGDKFDLGLLHICARYSIFKKFTIGDWSRSGEKWGDPLLAIRSDSDDDKENGKKQEFAANFGNNGYVILDKDDEIEMLERQRDAGYKIFGDFWDKLDAENSKGVNGQTGTQDQKSFVGSAEVHERILQGYSETRLLNLQYYHNDVTLPYLRQVNGGDSMYADLGKYEFKALRFMKKLEDPNEVAARQAAEQAQQQEVPGKPKKRFP